MPPEPVWPLWAHIALTVFAFVVLGIGLLLYPTVRDSVRRRLKAARLRATDRAGRNASGGDR